MRRLILLTLLSALVALMFTAGSEAQRRRRQQVPQGAPPPSPAITEALGELHWGMTKDEVLAHFEKVIADAHREAIRKARDAMQEDARRREMQDEVRRLQQSYIEFNGQLTGYETHFLGRGGEFTHRNGEAMLMYRDGNSENYYFFIGGRLWKWYKAFDAAVFEGKTFEEFAQALQGRFGPAREITEQLVGSTQSQRVLVWTHEHTRARALKQTFYNFYCLIFEDQETLVRLTELRPNIQEQHDSVHPVVEQVTGDNERPPQASDDIADRITGKNRNPEQAPAQ